MEDRILKRLKKDIDLIDSSFKLSWEGNKVKITRGNIVREVTIPPDAKPVDLILKVIGEVRSVKYGK